MDSRSQTLTVCSLVSKLGYVGYWLRRPARPRPVIGYIGYWGADAQCPGILVPDDAQRRRPVKCRKRSGPGARQTLRSSATSPPQYQAPPFVVIVVIVVVVVVLWRLGRPPPQSSALRLGHQSVVVLWFIGPWFLWFLGSLVASVGLGPWFLGRPPPLLHAPKHDAPLSAVILSVLPRSAAVFAFGRP